MPLTRGRSVRFDGLLHRDSFETGSFGNRSRLFSGLGPRRRVGGILGARAPVAQWIERWVPDPKVAGSSPVGRATEPSRAAPPGARALLRPSCGNLHVRHALVGDDPPVTH